MTAQEFRDALEPLNNRFQHKIDQLNQEREKTIEGSDKRFVVNTRLIEWNNAQTEILKYMVENLRKYLIK